MRIVRTRRAIDGFREVATYIAGQFGKKALLEFQQRTKEWTQLLKKMPTLGAVDEEISTDEIEYRFVTIYRRSIMEYRVEGDLIIIVDFYDTRRLGPTNFTYE